LQPVAFDDGGTLYRFLAVRFAIVFVFVQHDPEHLKWVPKHALSQQ